MSVSGALDASDHAGASNLLADAFFDNPAHVYIYPDPGKRRAQLKRLMRINFGAQLAIGRSFAARADDRSIKGMGFWHPPRALEVSFATLVRYGFLAIPLRDGVKAFGRLLHVVKNIEIRRKAALNGRQSWYLNNMVVAASARDRGLGGRLLGQQLREVVDPSGYPASLTTQKPQNVSFYTGLGFVAVDDTPVEDKRGNGFPNWIMTYEPR